MLFLFILANSDSLIGFFYQPHKLCFQKETLSRLSTVVPGLFADANDTEKYARNLIKLEVFYEELNFRAVTETAAYTVRVHYNKNI